MKPAPLNLNNQCTQNVFIIVFHLLHIHEHWINNRMNTFWVHVWSWAAVFPRLFSLKLDEILLFHTVRQKEQQDAPTPDLLCQMAALLHQI